MNLKKHERKIPMEDAAFIIMLKNEETGFLEKEIGSCRLGRWGAYLGRVHAEDENGERLLHMKLTTATDVKDWEYAAIFDYYDEEILSGLSLRVTPDTEGYNPAWDCVLPFEEDPESLQDIMLGLLRAHAHELDEIAEAIAGREEEYGL